jgi:hypothetical protein
MPGRVSPTLPPLTLMSPSLTPSIDRDGQLMARRLRIECPMAIYHDMARGSGRQGVVLDDDDRRHWINALERTVVARRWQLFAFVLMSNHFHLTWRVERELPRSAVLRSDLRAIEDLLQADVQTKSEG